MCECEPFYFGPNCDERIEYCAPDPCENGGTCVSLPEDSTYECLCLDTYEGANCETEILDPCEENPCSSSATCERISNVEHRCICPVGYEGDSCETKIDYCADYPCYNGGTCISHNTSYECICTRGYKGNKCKNRRNPCIPNPCIHGRCKKDDDGPWGEIYCECKDNYTGEFCEERITCPLGLSGENCSESVPALPQFLGEGQLVLSAPEEGMLPATTISISIRPEQPNGLVFLRWLDNDRNGDFILIGLKNGSVEFRFDARTGPAVIRSRKALEMNRWHVITVTIHGKNGSLRISTDPDHPRYGESKGPFIYVNLEGSLIHVGGYSNISAMPERFGEFTSGFHGCVSHLELNGRTVDLVTSSTKENVTQCKRGGPCSDTPTSCELGGRCRASYTGYWCECRMGYSGATCNSSKSQWFLYCASVCSSS